MSARLDYPEIAWDAAHAMQTICRDQARAALDEIDRLRAIRADAVALGRTKQQLLDNGDAIGSWTTKADVRQTGMSVHFKFENKVDVATTMQFLRIIENAPGMLVNAIRLLLGEEQIIDDGEPS